MAGAAEVAESVVSTDPVAPDEAPFSDGGYLELGSVLGVSRSIRARADGDGRRDGKAEVGFYVAGAWRRGPLFIEGRRGGVDGASIGVTLWHDRRRTLELLAAHLPGTVHVSYGTDDDEASAAGEAQRNADLVDRNRLLGSSGFRYREYRGDTLLQASAVMDWSNGNGVLLGAHAGHQWQLGNWNLQGVVGARWIGAALVDHLYGVDADEATDRFAAYEGREALFGEADLGITRALGRDWVLRSNLRVRGFGDGITDSPIVAGDEAVSAEVGIAYVF